jgi:hypothetical protein
LPDSALRVRNDAAVEICVAHSSGMTPTHWHAVITPPHLRKRAL